MRSKRWKVHAVFECRDCNEKFEWYLTAERQAREHAEKHGHLVQGEIGYAADYGERKTEGKGSEKSHRVGGI
jgi:hypothetical protein